MSRRTPASGVPTQAAAPRKRMTRPKEFVSFSRPTKSTRIMDVNDMNPAENYKANAVLFQKL